MGKGPAPLSAGGTPVPAPSHPSPSLRGQAAGKGARLPHQAPPRPLPDRRPAVDREHGPAAGSCSGTTRFLNANNNRWVKNHHVTYEIPRFNVNFWGRGEVNRCGRGVVGSMTQIRETAAELLSGGVVKKNERATARRPWVHPASPDERHVRGGASQAPRRRGPAPGGPRHMRPSEGWWVDWGDDATPVPSLLDRWTVTVCRGL